MQQLARAGHGRAREPRREVGRQARRGAGAREAFGEQEHIGRAGAGDGGDGIDQRLVLDPFDRADRGEQPVRDVALRRRRPSRSAPPTVMPRPIAAGVFGIARTIAQSAPSAPCRKASVLPAMIETASVPDRSADLSVGTTVAASCGLIAITITLASSTVAGLMRTPRAASAAISSAGRGSTTAIFCGSSPSASQPSQHRAAHLAGADEHERAGEVAECDIASPSCLAVVHARATRHRGEPDPSARTSTGCDTAVEHFAGATGDEPGYASPAVSNIAASSASRALLPAQTTNWNAW